MPSKNYTLFFIFSVGFVLISIAFITILGQTSKKDGESTDIRAKATVANSLKLVGTITEVNEWYVTVSQLKFESKKDEASDMGTWTVTLSPTVNRSGISMGKQVFINADASTFNTAEKTMTALAIKPL